MRNRLVMTAGVLTVAVSGLGFFMVGAASATPSSDCPPPGTSQQTAGYPPGLCRASENSGTFDQGRPARFDGSGFGADTNVIVSIHSTPTVLGSGTADSSGNFVDTVTIPSSTTPGRHTITLSGTNPDGTARALTTTITVSAAAAAQGSGLPFTGAEIAGMSLAGVALIGGGIVLLLAARRQRSAASTPATG